ncbi:EAL domain-containing protein [Marinospirillum sp. MEB164]|uniref:EAL domain-containing protein n=1 Tax=Marinospirillum alkalitolerans TaxID=3123374 RepID=A0ABW8PZE2_9GAMM
MRSIKAIFAAARSGWSLEFALLLPILLVLVLTGLWGGIAIYSIKHQAEVTRRAQEQDLSTLTLAADFTRSAALVHAQVMEALNQAQYSQISELELYFQHSDISENLAQLNQQVDALASSALIRAVNHGSSGLLREAFQDYRRFVVMATDIVTVDPSRAQHYVSAAQDQFIYFSNYAQRIQQLLSARTLEQQQGAYRQVHTYLDRLAWLALLSFVVMMGLALLLALRMTRRLRAITEALLSLAHSQQQGVPSLEAMQQIEQQCQNEFGAMAQALLRLRDAEREKRLAQEQVHHLAYYDSLTQLPNRRLMAEHLRHSVQSSRQVHQWGALLIFDLDHFKSINESEGHPLGDQLLLEVAQRLCSLVEASPLIGRLGGDEFAILLDALAEQPQRAANLAEDFAEDLLALLAQPYVLSESSYQITASMGIVLFDGREHSADDLLRFADSAMYLAKQRGRNQWCFYDPEIQSALEARNQLERDLRLAVETQQLFLVYQLQVDIEGRPFGAEALLRWQHPQQGLISPADFIPLAEESGLIIPIGYQVLRTACEQLVRWQAHPATDHLTLAVNVSAKQFAQADFVAQVLNILQQTQAPRHLLKLELTESMVLTQVEETIEKMHHIKALGLAFSMDDFGTGYSSLQYLKRLPLDQLKIDQSFVRDLQHEDDATIVRTIIAMGKALNLQVIAEGVETREQQDFLARYACDAFQGYLFCRPELAEEITQRLQQYAIAHPAPWMMEAPSTADF